MTDVCRRARRYVQEPGDAAGIELVDALRRAYGDEETYDLLRAVEIHSRISRRRRAISAPVRGPARSTAESLIAASTGRPSSALTHSSPRPMVGEVKQPSASDVKNAL
jgi:hypothetical protein